MSRAISASCLRGLRHRNIQVRTEANNSPVSEFLEEHVVALRRNHIELIARRNLRFLKPLIQSLEVVRSVFVLLDVVGGSVRDFLVALYLDNENVAALSDEEVRAKLSALWRVPFRDIRVRIRVSLAGRVFAPIRAKAPRLVAVGG
jgi:chromosome condensin MukBEF MukE localization factor